MFLAKELSAADAADAAVDAVALVAGAAAPGLWGH